MTEPEVGRKVRQLGGDVYEIYDLLDGISKTQAQHGAALANLGARFDGLETRFDGLETRFDGLETRVNDLDAKFTGKFDSVDAKLDLVLERIGHGGN